ncbi:MAG: DUF1592 domain-containing protein [Gammaproteobacteria bacterium]|nr:DUF1592 domain-containing protein [Gammaproteobacteria bacterium]
MRSAVLISAAGSALFAVAFDCSGGEQASAAVRHWQLIDGYCVDCHNIADWAGGVAFDTLTRESVTGDIEIWEAAIRKMRGGLMPPPGQPRPAARELRESVTFLETTLDNNAGVTPAVGFAPLRRLNRREYANAVRDLLGLEIAVADLLPDESPAGGFDTFAEVLQVTPTFIDQFVNAARVVAEQAVGQSEARPVTVTFGNAADMVLSGSPRGGFGRGMQQNHEAGMPFGTRGGMSVIHTFPAAGEYRLTIGDLALAREVPRMEFTNTLVALLDGKEFFRTTIGGEQDHKAIDQLQDPAVANINQRLRDIPFQAPAGQHRLTVSFIKRSYAESDERMRTLAVEGGQERVTAVHALQVRGPMQVDSLMGSASRARIFTCQPVQPSAGRECAETIIRRLARQAFSRPVTETDMRQLMAFYDAASSDGFEAGVRDALSAILASPHFMYRAQTGTIDGDRMVLDQHTVAARLALFLWSSLPDETLLDLADSQQLLQPAVLSAQVRRMLADPRAMTMTKDFAFQWLNVGKLAEIEPDRELFPQANRQFDPRPKFREELRLFIDSILRSDRPVTELLTASHTFVDERLAMHYGIDDVKGSRFQRIELAQQARNGLLGKGAILMLTANPNRTAPVLRGAWILERLLGTPPAAPPPNVEALAENGPGQVPRTVRERMALHSENPNCHGCHGVMDPLGFALENFDTVGQYHERDRLTGQLIDTAAVLPDGRQLQGVRELREALVESADLFVQALTENLLSYALGRKLDHRDMPTVRAIARHAARNDYRFDAIVLGIVSSDSFRQRQLPPAGHSDALQAVASQAIKP